MEKPNLKNIDLKKHFYNRFGFGISFNDYQEPSGNFNPRKTLKALLAENHFVAVESTSTLPLPAVLKSLSKKEKKAFKKADKKAFIQLNNDWIAHMASTNNVLGEKMSLFWHDHFACKAQNSKMAANQINFIRQNALGNFKTLVHGIAKDPAMLLYLNNQQNRKNKPNENFARELMELFTMGIGNYSEADIKETARAFTGWKMDNQGKFQLNAKAHDTGSKTIFGQTGNWEGEDVIDMILQKKECAAFISSKIARFILGPSVDKSELTNFANVLFNSNYDIIPLLEVITESNSFLQSTHFGNDIVSPVELLVKMERSFGLTFQKNSGRIYVQRTLGQFLLQPPNVSGWPMGKDWIDTSTLTLRLRLSRAILLQQDTGQRAKASFAQGEDLAENLSRQASNRLGTTYDLAKVKTAWMGFTFDEKVNAAADWLTPGMRNMQLTTAIAALTVPAEKETEYALALVAGLPEFQLK